MEMPPSLLAPESAPPVRRRRRRPWRDKFRVAFRGFKFGVRGQSSFSVHFFFAILVVVAAWAFTCTLLEWCVLLGCIGLVLTAEMFNSAIEILFRGFDEETRERSWPALDIASAAVLIASITAAVLGLLIFLPRLVERLRALGLF
jgi:diacylglycerol kinase